MTIPSIINVQKLYTTLTHIWPHPSSTNQLLTLQEASRFAHPGPVVLRNELGVIHDEGQDGQQHRASPGVQRIEAKLFTLGTLGAAVSAVK